MTVLEVIQRSSEFLARKEIESPRLQIELLLASVLRMPRLNLYLNYNRSLSEAELASVRGLVQRRGSREPLQHILGSASFCGLEMIVTRDVLVPRPETEILAQMAWEFLRERAKAGQKTLRVLDFGTGSGCLAITLAVQAPQAEVHGLDNSEAALAIARQNAKQHGVVEKVQFHSGNSMENLPKNLRFDLLVSNPPYIPTKEIDTLEPEVKDYDPRLALDGGPDGLDVFRLLAAEAAGILAAEGRIMLEFGDGQELRLAGIFAPPQWIIESVEKDYSKRPRILIARRAV